MCRRALILGTLASAAFSLLTLWELMSTGRTSMRASNERNAGGRVKSLASAEADYRGNDRDGNGIQDFWTGDVAGLYRLGLIERGMALADLRPIVPLCPRPIPFDGYYYRALDADDSVVPAEGYRQTTDPASGNVHHLTKFGFVAIPAWPGISGKSVVMINENNSLWAYRSGWTGTFLWPSDHDRKYRCFRFG